MLVIDSPNSYVEALTPSVFGGRACEEVIKVK